MTGLETAIFLLGAALIIISFFVLDNKEKKEGGKDVSAFDLSESAEQVKNTLVETINKEVDYIVNDSKDKLEALSNDKIMAVGEYSDQVIEKIEGNHKEVVFLYQMLTEKEDELKLIAQQLDNSRIECEKLINLAKKEAVQTKEDVYVANIPTAVIVNETENRTEPQKTEALTSSIASFNAPFEEAEVQLIETYAHRPPRQTENKTAKSAVRQTRPKTVGNSGSNKVKMPGVTDTDTGMISHNDEIIALYKKSKSVKEISKLLNMAQGEVKLIIDLYCK